MSAMTVPVTITTHAKALTSRLSLETELKQVLDYTLQTCPDTQSVDLEYYTPMDDPRDEQLLLVVWRPGELPLDDQTELTWRMGLLELLHPLLAERFRLEQRYLESYGR